MCKFIYNLYELDVVRFSSQQEPDREPEFREEDILQQQQSVGQHLSVFRFQRQELFQPGVHECGRTTGQQQEQCRPRAGTQCKPGQPERLS